VAEDPRLQPVLKEAGLETQKIEAAIQARKLPNPNTQL